MNRTQRENLVILAWFGHDGEEIAKAAKIPQKDMRFAKQAFSLIRGIFERMAKTIPREDLAGIVSIVKSNRPALVANSEIVDINIPVDDVGGFVKCTEKKGALFDICDYAINGFCVGCEEKQPKKCNLRKALKTMGTGSFDENDPHCCYRIPKELVNAENLNRDSN